jgi:hypothetical protein
MPATVVTSKSAQQRGIFEPAYLRVLRLRRAGRTRSFVLPTSGKLQSLRPLLPGQQAAVEFRNAGLLKLSKGLLTITDVAGVEQIARLK